MKTTLFILFFAFSTYGFAQQLSYTPKNPAFGGDPFNYNWLLNSANEQNSFSDDNSDFDLSEFDSLSGGFNDPRFQNQFGGENPEPGTSTNGNFETEVYESSEGLVINILDITTGEFTQLIIPN
ncbi:MAG: curli assembly protein CsgF [Flavobacteriales bacterium]|jgi:curli production assembly/transport component CsgF|uniref:curli assembly protein CsgF n=1 Tax=Candidatus Ulvibacter alkanivorans TaxID=2267620 RepID=UPI000DF41376|nr:curli assembly protein CsgF [Candidatus Ulvibacter alkanivorans]MCH2489596.1 curli assembly protein CsgF [Flavobacteriales bacterium]